MKAELYSKSHSLVNLSSSILKHYGITPFHNGIPEIDELLKKSNKHNVCIILFDGLGKNIKHSYLNEKDSLIRHEFIDITSVFPPTTVAATTAFLSAKYPIETGWIGWKQRFNDLNMIIEMFNNNIAYSYKPLNQDISYQRCGYKNIIDLINETSKYKAYKIFPSNIDKEGAKDVKHFFELVDYKVKGDNQFTYAYWAEPDHTIHEKGTKSKIVKNMVKEINKLTAKLAKNNPQTLFLIIADHGIIDCEYLNLEEHEILHSMLECKPSIESRAMMLKIKNDNVEEFINLFKKHYDENEFLIYYKTDLINNEIFGCGAPHKEFENFLGDLLIVSKTNKTFRVKDDYNEYHNTLAEHAGATEEEKIISVSIYNK